jgi:hypothetical protein
MNQPPLFVETVYDALKGIVAALGGAKIVGARLWPEKTVDDARKRLLDCLNPERDEKLDPEQVILLLRLGREADFHVAKHWLDVETGYLPSAPADPGDEQARQVAAIESAAQQLQRALIQLEKMRDRKPLQRVG